MTDESGQPGAPQSSGQICQHCGVTVAPGYPKCPKCHGPMPTVHSPLARHATAPAGGTSAASEPGGFAMWIALATVAIVIGAVVFFVVRSGDDGTGAGDDETAAIAGDAGDEGASDAVAAAPIEDEPIDEGDEVDVVAVQEALDNLEQALAEGRVFSGVEVSPDDSKIVRIESAQCDDPGMREAIADAAPDLLSAGFVGVQCFTRHGTLTFETGL